MTWTYNLGDVLAEYAQNVMDILQNYVAGNTVDGRPRNALPYFQFGQLAYDNRTPPTVLPAVQWKQGDGQWDYSRQVGGAFSSGSLGSISQQFLVKIYGNDRQDAWTEHVYMLQSIFAMTPRPPIDNLKTEWQGGAVQQNSKETCIMSWSVPILVPAVPPPIAQLSTISASLLFVTGSISSQFPYPPNSGSLSGSTFPTRTLIVRRQ